MELYTGMEIIGCFHISMLLTVVTERQCSDAAGSSHLNAPGSKVSLFV